MTMEMPFFHVLNLPGGRGVENECVSAIDGSTLESIKADLYSIKETHKVDA